MHPPFGSAMVQGEAIALLVRGYLLTQDEKYLECAEKALQPYETQVEDGGVLRYFMGMPFYEEYPTPTPSLVLNGFIGGWSIESAVYGALMGLASTGMHQAFKQFIEKTAE